MAGAPEKALELSKRFMDKIFESSEFFIEFYDMAKKEFDACYNCISYVADLSDHYGNKEYAAEVRDRFNAMLDINQYRNEILFGNDQIGFRNACSQCETWSQSPGYGL